MKSTLEFWLNFNNGKEKFQLPVNPAEVEFTFGRNVADTRVMQLGEISTLGGVALKEISFSSFFPKWFNETYCEYDGFIAPWDAVKLVERFASHPRFPIRLIISGTPINIAVTLRSFTYKSVGGDPDSVEFTMSFKEFKYATYKTIKLTIPPIPKPKQPTPKPVGKSGKKKKKVTTTARPDDRKPLVIYYVRPGDNIYLLAKKFFNNMAYAKYLAFHNHLNAPWYVSPGMTLRIPNSDDIAKMARTGV